ncbi:MAG TPA: cysteine desulfurase family protein [Pyrinomonadaceae bacterium]|nr:cysteine desulfurase family protein [Pyrinomonadaceae bacterium]HMP64820.1 cysteine desulfurase family protein [Pyrinomonadaceae bacterium]
MFRRVYLDNSATTPVDPRVLDAMMPFLTDKFGNASSIHFYGQETRAAVDKARHQVAGLLNARPAEIVFTSGGTESNNLAIKGLIESIIALRSDVSVPPHIITTQIEHPAVKMACEDLENEGVSVTFLPVAENGVIRIADVENAITDSTVLISIMTANNEIGTLQPVSEIGRFVRDQRRAGRKIYFHTDAVQAVGKVPIDVEEIGCDLLSLSAHKFHAPKGVGALYVRRGTRLHAQNIGGRQERGLRGGTEPVPLIAGMGAAAEIAGTELAGENERLAALRNRFEDNILERIDGSRLNGDRSLRLPNISNISFEGIEGEALLINLDMQGIAVSTGSACSSGSLEPSPVIRALGADDQRARSAIRFSLGRMNTEEDIDAALNTLPRSIEDLRAISRPR